MEQGGFNVTKWASNSKEVLSLIEEQEQSQSSTTDFNASEPLKVPGICWNTLNDCFVFCVPPYVLTVSDPETKRSLLSIASRIFDPMGLITPFTIRAKMLFKNFGREVCSGRVIWMKILPFSGCHGGPNCLS